MVKYKRSAIPYMGNKYKLLKHLIPLFPKQCDIFVDLFGGSGTVCMNYRGGVRTIYNEFNHNIVELLKVFKINTFEELDIYFQQKVDKYDLKTGLKRCQFRNEEEFLLDTNMKKVRYNQFRTDYNNSIDKDYRDLYILANFSCNHLIRFNQKNEFNASFGSNGNYNDNIRKMIKDTIVSLRDIEIIEGNAFDFDLSILTQDGFVYLDPPYSGTEAVYNEKRAFGGWTIESDYKLFGVLEELDKKGVKWGLSNVFENRGIKNEHLIKWCEENGWTVVHLDRNYNPFSRGNSNNDEVFICNYKIDGE